MRSCPVCRGLLVPDLPEVRDHVTGETFRLQRCIACDLAVTDPVPRSLDRFYPPRYRRYRGPVAAILRAFYRRRVRVWTDRVGGAGRALELGCGDGWMLSALREHGLWTCGTERSVESARPARENGLRVFVGDLAALRPEARFDLIVLFHVLEHLDDPAATLAACAARLTPTGRIVISVPNLASWQARLFGPRWFHLDVPRHLVHFSPRALDRAFAAAGLARVRTSFVSAEHDPYGWVQSSLDGLGLPQGALMHGLTGAKDGSPLAFVVAAALSVPLLAAASVLSVVGWWAGAGAILEVWAAPAIRRATNR